MRIAIGSDMAEPVAYEVATELERRGHQVQRFGAIGDTPRLWPQVGTEVARRVADGEFDQGVLFCWTGTGVSIAANKVKGVRAALCHDAETARGARMWNDANILVMSLRATSVPVAKEILDAWFAASPSQDQEDQQCLQILQEIEANRP